MQFTDYGMRLATAERPIANEWLDTPAEARRNLLRANREVLILLTGGNTAAGRTIRIFAHSYASAFAHAETNPNIRFAWHLRGDGGRRLVFRA